MRLISITRRDSPLWLTVVRRDEYFVINLILLWLPLVFEIFQCHVTTMQGQGFFSAKASSYRTHSISGCVRLSIAANDGALQLYLPCWDSQWEKANNMVQGMQQEGNSPWHVSRARWPEGPPAQDVYVCKLSPFYFVMHCSCTFHEFKFFHSNLFRTSVLLTSLAIAILLLFVSICVKILLKCRRAINIFIAYF